RQHLGDVVAGQPVRRGHHDDVQLGQRRVIAQPVQPRPAQAGAAIAVITVDVLVIQLPAALGHRRAQPVKLLLDSLRLRLASSRYPRIHRRPHQAPPPRSASDPAGRPARPSGPAADRPDPTGARHRGSGRADGTHSRSGSSGSPARTTSPWRADPRNRSGRCHQVRLSCTRRTQQNLPFVIRPSRLTTTSATLLSGKMPPPAAPAADPSTWPPSAPPSSRPSKTPATCTSPKADATTPPPPKPSASTASIRTDTDIHGTRRSPGVQWPLIGRREELAAVEQALTSAGSGPVV